MKRTPSLRAFLVAAVWMVACSTPSTEQAAAPAPAPAVSGGVAANEAALPLPAPPAPAVAQTTPTPTDKSPDPVAAAPQAKPKEDAGPPAEKKREAVKKAKAASPAPKAEPKPMAPVSGTKASGPRGESEAPFADSKTASNKDTDLDELSDGDAAPRGGTGSGYGRGALGLSGTGQGGGGASADSAAEAPAVERAAPIAKGKSASGYGAGRLVARPAPRPSTPRPPSPPPPPPTKKIAPPPVEVVEETLHTEDQGGEAAAAASYANANAYYENTYQGGSGARDHLEDLIAHGLVIDGKSLPLDALAAGYRQAFPLPAEKALSLSVATEHRSLLATGGRTTLQIGLQGIKTETKERPPLRLSLVIDRSGSMKKEDRLDKVREAALALVDKLGPKDEIAIIAFDNKAEVLCEMGLASRPQVKDALRRVSPGGGTNIFDGLTLGYQQLNAGTPSPDAFQVTFLFSDGEVTAGEQDPQKFSELTRSAFASKIATTTFGVGLSFNESLMMGISQSGKGNYHFLKDAASSEKAILRELDDYTHVVATNVNVRIKLAEGVKLVRVYGAQALNEDKTQATKADEELLDDRAREELGIAEDRSKDDQDGIKMLIPQFYLGDTHVILLEVEVPAGDGARPVAEAFVKYKDMIFAKNGEESKAAQVGTASDKTAQVRSLDSSVKKNILGFETGAALVQVAELLRAGRAAEAQKTLDEQRGILATAASLWVDDDLRRDAELMNEYQKVVVALGKKGGASEEGETLAKAFVYSGFQRTR